jgi:CBS domain-containing protein
VTFRSLLKALREGEDLSDLALPVSRAMVSDVVTVTPGTELTEALELMEDRDIGCLPVVEGEQLVGMLRERDFLRVAKQALASPTEETSVEGGALGGVPS